MGDEYLGLSGLLNNIIGFLSISELGLSTAIGFSLYKPLAENNIRDINALMSLYRKAYAIIGVVVAVGSVLLFPFVDFFVDKAAQPEGTYAAYFLFSASTCAGYFLSYKSTLLFSDNRGYEIVSFRIIFNIVQTVIQAVYLLIFKEYIGYIVIQAVFSVALLALQNRYVAKKYVNIDFYSKEKLTPLQKKTVQKSIGGLMVNKLGDYLVNSTDNLIITKLVSLSATGIYSNYIIIRDMVNGYISTVFAGIGASMGNVVATENNDRKLEIFETTFFCAYYIYSFEASCFMCLFNPFISDIWIGGDYVLPVYTVAIFVFNNFLTGMRIPLITMKSAAGLYLEDAAIPFVFTVINLVASVILAKYIGITGVILGTVIGSLCTADWYRPFVVYRNVFKAPIGKYFIKYAVYLLCGVITTGIAYLLCSFVVTGNKVLDFFVIMVIAALVPLVLNTCLFYKTKEFSAAMDIGKRLLNGALMKIRKK